MALEKYHAKRNFKQTPELRGEAARRRTENLGFVIQKTPPGTSL